MNGDDKLIRMANQIASFFKSYPEGEARTGVRDHIDSFWTPKMRDRLAAAVAAGGAAALDPLVVRAVAAPVAADSPVGRVTDGPSEAGEVGAMDAG